MMMNWSLFHFRYYKVPFSFLSALVLVPIVMVDETSKEWNVVLSPSQ